MPSTFHGLETARRGMVTQQSALYTTGHNISNANTPGFSRQRVNVEQTTPYPPASLNRPLIPGQTGTGVEAGSIQRMRDDFLDLQFRAEQNKSGYYGAKSDALTKLEEVMNEPSETGLAKAMDQFWQSIQDLSAQPENAGSRATVRQRGIAVSETFQYLSDSLTGVRANIEKETEITINKTNSITSQIDQLNQQIASIEPNGYVANDLYDERDKLVDELSEIVNIKVTAKRSGGLAKAEAAGIYQIDIMNENGTKVLSNLVDPNNGAKTLAKTSGDPLKITVDGTELPFHFRGKLQGLAESFNQTYPDMQKKIDDLAYKFTTEFNKVHNGDSKYGLDTANTPSQNNNRLFFKDLTALGLSETNTKGAAKMVGVHEDILGNLNNIAASLSGFAGDNGNALALADIRYQQTQMNGQLTTIEDFYGSTIGEMAVDSQSAKQFLTTADTLKTAVEDRRQSVSGVSLDEEMANLIKFQQAYNASARNINIIDEMLDKIINLGVGGR